MKEGRGHCDFGQVADLRPSSLETWGLTSDTSWGGAVKAILVVARKTCPLLTEVRAGMGGAPYPKSFLVGVQKACSASPTDSDLEEFESR